MDELEPFEERNDFRGYRMHHEVTWLKKNGSIVRMEHMSFEHLMNAVYLMERCNQTDLRAYRGLKKELRKRGF